MVRPYCDMAHLLKTIIVLITLPVFALTGIITLTASADEKLQQPAAAAEENAPPPELWGELPPLPPLEKGGEEKPHTIWTCSMHPNIQLPEPGQCPICFMDLIEVAVDSGALESLRQVTLSEEARRLAQVETTPVTRGTAASSIRMVGKIDYDETLVSSITAWINGRIDKLHVAYTGSQVRAGQPMAEIYSPELLAAQAELIEAVAASAKLNGTDNTLLRQTISRTESASRKKLELLGLTEKQIQEVVTRKTPADHITLTAPISGIVIKKEVNEGMYVKTGTPIYSIADLSKLWVILEAYESDLQAIAMGQEVVFTAEAYPGRQFSGKVSYIDPVVDNKTRTIRVRLNIDNPDLLLKPGMFVRAVAKSKTTGDSDGQPLLIPASAPLMTGKRSIVYVQPPDQEGVYVGREIILGPRRGDYYQVAGGLQEGELVVSRGNFKIDSAIQIQGRPSMMNPFTAKEETAAASLPSLFASKLNLLNEKFIRLSKDIHDGDDSSREKNLQAFAEVLKGIQSDFLDQDIKLDWDELAMTLNADVILMREAQNRDEMLQIYAEMANHFYQVRTRFQLPPPQLAKEGSEQVRRQLAVLLDKYLVLRKNLAADAADQALAAIPDVLREVKDFTAELAASGSDKTAEISTGLQTAAEQLKNSSGIAEIRTAFYPLSRALIDAVSTFGVSSSYAVYQHYCPMAFNDTGATWLDTSETIDNPYFGAEMLRCGEVQAQFKLEEQQ